MDSHTPFKLAGRLGSRSGQLDGRSGKLGGRSGFTLAEVLISLAILAVVLVAATVNVAREGQALSAMARKTTAERRAEVMLERIFAELRYAQAAAPRAFLTASLTSGAASAAVDTTAGFPSNGTLLLEPGTGSEERIGYDGLALLPPRFTGLDHGLRCTGPSGHASGIQVRWAGIAEILEDQAAPLPSFFDGRSLEPRGPTFYRGDGSGFSFRVPIDPGMNGTYLDANGDVQWGAELRGATLTSGRSCVAFEPVALVAESDRGADLNRDGDQVDVFDLGRIELRTWDDADPGSSPATVGLCSAMILQEQCAWSSDLDADGFEDPIFLWDPVRRRLRVRMFLLTTGQHETSEVRRVESALFLENGIEG